MRVYLLIVGLLVMATNAIGADMPLNPDVRQDNLETTTCLHGWTRTVRPPVSYTGDMMIPIDGAPLKRDYCAPRFRNDGAPRFLDDAAPL